MESTKFAQFVHQTFRERLLASNGPVDAEYDAECKRLSASRDDRQAFWDLMDAHRAKNAPYREMECEAIRSRHKVLQLIHEVDVHAVNAVFREKDAELVLSLPYEERVEYILSVLECCKC